MSTQVEIKSVVAEGYASKKVWALALGLSVFALVVLALYAGTSFTGPIAKKPVSAEAASLAANPELALARRYAVPAKAGESAFFAANPELVIARRYGVPETVGAESAFLAANPELMVARRHMSSASEQTDTALLEANPEIRVYRGYVNALRIDGD